MTVGSRTMTAAASRWTQCDSRAPADKKRAAKTKHARGSGMPAGQQQQRRAAKPSRAPPVRYRTSREEDDGRGGESVGDRP
ncbi:hypothetical protein MRX96_015966 [Rhipicephalus microplus]